MSCNPGPRAGLLARLHRDRRGISALVFAVSAIVLFGAGALAVDASFWIQQRRDAQTAADAAAQSGALELVRDRSAAGQTRAEDIARDVAGLNAWTQIDSLIVTASQVEIVVSAEQTRWLSAVLGLVGENPVVRARAVAGLRVVGPICTLTSGTIAAGGNATINAPGCVMWSNDRFNVFGNAGITAGAAYTGRADCEVGGSAVLDLSQDCVGGADPMPFPRSLQDLLNEASFPQPLPDCQTIESGQGTTVSGLASPGQWCNSSGARRRLVFENASLSPGVYYIQNADVTFSGTTTCDGCTFVLMGNNPGRLTVNAQAGMDLKAPSIRPNTVAGDQRDYTGVLFYRHCTDPNAPCGPSPAETNTTQINGSASAIIEGAMYFPYHNVVLNGSSGYRVNDCTPIISNDLTLLGTTRVGIAGCDGLGLGEFDPETGDFVALTARLLE